MVGGGVACQCAFVLCVATPRISTCCSSHQVVLARTAAVVTPARAVPLIRAATQPMEGRVT